MGSTSALSLGFDPVEGHEGGVLRDWEVEIRYLGLVVIVSDWGSSFTPFRIGKGIPTRTLELGNFTFAD